MPKKRIKTCGDTTSRISNAVSPQKTFVSSVQVSRLNLSPSERLPRDMTVITPVPQ